MADLSNFGNIVPGVFTPVLGKHQSLNLLVIQRVNELPTNQVLTSEWADQKRETHSVPLMVRTRTLASSPTPLNEPHGDSRDSSRERCPPQLSRSSYGACLNHLVLASGQCGAFEL